MRISSAYMESLMAGAMAAREAFVRVHGDDQDVYSYIEDPDISEHDKDLQGSLDYDMEHPDDVLRDVHEQYVALRASEWSPYVDFLGSLDDELQRLERVLSDEGIAELEAEYDRYLRLREEALAKGFVRYGNCRNVRCRCGQCQGRI